MLFAPLNLAGLVRQLQSGELSALELVEQCLARIEQLDSEVNAMVHVAADEARAQESGRSAICTTKK